MGGDAEQFMEWVFDVYKKQLALNKVEGSGKYKRFLNTYTWNLDTFGLSGARRIQSFQDIKFGYPLRRAGYITATFGIVMGTDRSLYSYVYWPHGQSVPEYACISPSFVSRDGEYRRRFMLYKRLESEYESLTKFFSPLEADILQMTGNGEIGLEASIYPDQYETQKVVGNFIEINRLPIKFLVIALVSDAVRAYTNSMQNHANPVYTRIMTKLYTVFAKTIQKIPFEVSRTFGLTELNTTTCGQKLVPLTIRESVKIGDINFSPWRETWANRRATDLVINGVAPMFSMYDNWTFLDGIDRHFFENKSMHDKFDRSLKAEGVLQSLRDARDKTERSSHVMSQLDAHIYESVTYAQDFLILSEIALCSVSEYVGYTYRSLPDILTHTVWTGPDYLRVYQNSDMVARYMFDLCYGALALHTRQHIIHSDIHLNNITIYELDDRYIATTVGNTVKFEETLPDATIAYILDESEASTYVFPHDGWFACLIDFSRVVVGAGASAQLKAEQGEVFTKGFYRAQVNRALRILHHYVPRFTEKHQESLKGLLFTKFDLMFKVMSAIDFLAIGKSLTYMYTQIRDKNSGSSKPDSEHVKFSLKLAPDAIKMAAALEKYALTFLITHLTDLVEDRRVKEIPFAGAQIIPALFSKYMYSNQKHTKTTLVDVYNMNAPLKYSATEYDRYPPWARFDVLGKHLYGLKMDVMTSDRGEAPFLKSLKLNGRFEVLQEHLLEKISDRPAEPTSSWIASGASAFSERFLISCHCLWR